MSKTAKKTTAPKTSAMIYTLSVNHQDGSRKLKVHATFDKLGKDAAIALGKKLKLQETTLRSWCSTWNSAKYVKANAKAKAAATKGPKSKVAKAA